MEDALRDIGQRLHARMPELVDRLFLLLDEAETKPNTALSIIKELLSIIEQSRPETPPPAVEIIVRVEDGKPSC